jgi:hypothetical protein
MDISEKEAKWGYLMVITQILNVLKSALSPTNDKFLKPKKCCDIVKKI